MLILSVVVTVHSLYPLNIKKQTGMNTLKVQTVCLTQIQKEYKSYGVAMEKKQTLVCSVPSATPSVSVQVHNIRLALNEH